MSESWREEPTPGVAMTAAAAVDCPECGTQLRLLHAATAQTPIACCICGATFYMQPIKTAPMSEPAALPRRAVGDNRPEYRVVGPAPTRPHDRGTSLPGAAPGTMMTPAPPAPTPGTRSAPGMPKPVELPEHLVRGFRTRWMESVLGAVLVLLVVVAACAGGFVLLKAIRSNSTSSTPSADVPGDPDPAAVDQQPANGTPAAGDPKSPAPTPAPVTGMPKPLPRPDNLVGMWESRLDDGTMSAFVFRQNGTAVIIQAGEPPPAPSYFNWFLVERKGDEHVIDIGPDFGQIGNARITMRFTSAEAFSLLRQMRAGVVQPGGELRYVRIGPPPDVWPPPPPAGSFVGPPAPERKPVKPPASSPAPAP